MAKELKQVLTIGGGINTGVPPLFIDDSEHTYSRNLDSWKHPSLATRPPRSTYGAVNSTNAISLGQRNNQYLHIVDGNTWKYWNPATTAYVNLTTTLSSTEAEIAEFNTGTAKYSILMNSTQKYYWDGTSTCLVLGTSDTPLTKIFAIHKGRVYGARDNDIKYCALNLINNWASTDSGAGTIDVTRAKGAITGMVEYLDHVIVFTEHSMHELWGTGPSNYNLTDVEGGRGCISHRSITECNGSLYWMWYDGIYVYNGGTHQKVSQPVKDYIDNINLTYKTKIVGGAAGDYLYMSIPYGASAVGLNLLLKYDTKLDKWYPETGNFIDFIVIGNTLYGIDNAGQTWNMRDYSATEGKDSASWIPWNWVSKPFNSKPSDDLNIGEIYSVLDMTTNSTTLTLGWDDQVYNNDSTSFDTLKTFTPSSNVQNVKAIMPNSLTNLNWYRLRYDGSGHIEIHSVEINGGVG